MQQGEVWIVDLPTRSGKEQSGHRPAIMIQEDVYGENSPLALMVPLTSQLKALRFPATVQIEPTSDNGLAVSSVALVFQTRALDRARYVRRIGELASKDLQAVLAELNRLTGQYIQDETDEA